MVFTANDSQYSADSNLAALQVENLLLSLSLNLSVASQGEFVAALGNLSLTNGSFITNRPVKIFLNGTLVGTALTNIQGFYSLAFQAPQTIGAFQVRANATFAGLSAERSAALQVDSAPAISNVSHSPNYPKPSENVTVSAAIIDNGQVLFAVLFYSFNNLSWFNTTMASISGG